MIHFLVPAGRAWTLQDYLRNRGRNVADRFRILEYESLTSRAAFDPGTYVLAGLGGVSSNLRPFVEQLYGQLSVAKGVRLLNHPTRTLGRFQLLETLWQTNRNEFRAVRAADDLTGLRYPVFLRSERRHDGALSPLLRSPREIEAAIGRALLRGRSLDDLLVVEFCDTADAAGRYRKYCAFIVGNRILARNLEISHEWVIKDSDREFSRPALLEEGDYISRNPHERPLAEIFDLAAVEYGRIDYGMKDGRVQTWEINLHPTIGPTPHPSPNRVPDELQPICEESRRQFYRGFEEAWRAVDLNSGGGSAVRVMPYGAPIPAGFPVEGRARRLLRTVRRTIRPLRPILEPLAAPVLPWLGRLARRRRTR